MRRVSSKEKHIPYFKFLDSLREKECPLCFLAEKRVSDFFDGLLYESINDRGFRARFRTEGGFCSFHAHMFADYHDGLAVSLIHKDLLEDECRRLFVAGTPNTDELPSHGSCMVCGFLRKTEEENLEILRKFWDDEEFKAELLGSQGLCIPHFKAVLSTTEKLPKWLRDFQNDRLRGLFELVEKYLGYCNFSDTAKPVLSEEDLHVYSRLVRTLYGYPGMASPMNWEKKRKSRGLFS
jgi:hypothetical protein